MHISIVWHDRSFNINLHSSEGKDAFLELKGCRIQQSQKGEFISMPSTKNAATGKYWNHAYINAAWFQYLPVAAFLVLGIEINSPFCDC